MGRTKRISDHELKAAFDAVGGYYPAEIIIYLRGKDIPVSRSTIAKRYRNLGLGSKKSSHNDKSSSNPEEYNRIFEREILCPQYEDENEDRETKLENSQYIKPAPPRIRQYDIPIVRSTYKPLILSPDELANVIKKSVTSNDYDGMDMEEFVLMAKHVLNFFGFNERIIDNVLYQEDRDIFYMMEDCGILSTETEETTLYDGREWRINYWKFRRDKINELLEKSEVEEKTKTEINDVYSTVPPDVWARYAEV